MNGHRTPPRLAERLLERSLPAGIVGESILGDAHEEYLEALERRGPWRARGRYWATALRIALRYRGRGRRRTRPAAARGNPIGGLAGDLRQAGRRIGRDPGFTAVAALTLGLGLGATTAVFSVVDGVLLRPLGYPEPDRVVTVWHALPGIGLEQMGLTTGTYFTIRDDNRSFEEIGLVRGTQVAVTGHGEPERVPAALVSAGTLGVLGARPAAGRLFVEADDAPGAPLRAVLGHGYWSRRFGADPGVVGRTLSIEGEPVEVIGVLADGFRLPFQPADLVFTLRLDPARSAVGGFNYPGLARLRPGITAAEAAADVDRLVPLAIARFPGDYTEERARETGLSGLVIPLAEEVVGNVGTTLWLLFAAGAVVLAIGCANVANLFLVRAEGRRYELAVRAALGAGRGRLAAQFLIEGTLLALLGGAIGVGLAYGGVRLLALLAPAGILPRFEEIGIGRDVLALAAAATALASLVCGLLPALGYARRPASVLVEAGRGGTGRRRHRTRRLLAAAQLALALTLLVGAGLMVRSLAAMWEVDPGFERPDEVLTFQVGLPEGEVPDDAMVPALHEQILERVAALSGVTAAGLSTSMPMDRRLMTNMTAVEEFPDRDAPSRRYKFIAEGYFETLGIPLLAGRGISWDDVRGRRPVAVVSESFAREYWPDPAAALGRRIAQDTEAGWREIVGVAGDVYEYGPTRPPLELVYWPIAVEHFWGRDLLVMRDLVYAIRVPGLRQAEIADRVRRAVWSIDPDLPVSDLRTESEIVAGVTARTRFTVLLLGLAAALAFAIGIVGLYGVVSYIVSTRRREIAIRMAMGARRAEVSAMVVRDGLALAVAGLAAGLVASAGLTRLMRASLFGVQPVDPPTYLAASLVLLAVALVASYLPARRAAAVDPIRALTAD